MSTEKYFQNEGNRNMVSNIKNLRCLPQRSLNFRRKCEKDMIILKKNVMK